MVARAILCDYTISAWISFDFGNRSISPTIYEHVFSIRRGRVFAESPKLDVSIYRQLLLLRRARAKAITRALSKQTANYQFRYRGSARNESREIRLILLLFARCIAAGLKDGSNRNRPDGGGVYIYICCSICPRQTDALFPRLQYTWHYRFHLIE